MKPTNYDATNIGRKYTVNGYAAADVLLQKQRQFRNIKVT